jgi:hypothetical protein
VAPVSRCQSTARHEDGAAKTFRQGSHRDRLGGCEIGKQPYYYYYYREGLQAFPARESNDRSKTHGDRSSLSVLPAGWAWLIWPRPAKFSRTSVARELEPSRALYTEPAVDLLRPDIEKSLVPETRASRSATCPQKFWPPLSQPSQFAHPSALKCWRIGELANLRSSQDLSKGCSVFVACDCSSILMKHGSGRKFPFDVSFQGGIE